MTENLDSQPQPKGTPSEMAPRKRTWSKRKIAIILIAWLILLLLSVYILSEG